MHKHRSALHVAYGLGVRFEKIYATEQNITVHYSKDISPTHGSVFDLCNDHTENL